MRSEKKEADEEFIIYHNKIFRQFGKKWTYLLVLEISKYDKIRFNHLKTKFQGITSSTLSSSLKELETYGVINRLEISKDQPFKVEYVITEEGRKFLESLKPFLEWNYNKDKIELEKRTTNAIVIDENLNSRKMLTKLLSNLKINIIHSYNDAADISQEDNPNIIFVDVSLPELNGITAIEMLKEVFPDGKIVAITGDLSLETSTLLKKHNVSTVLHKPYTVSSLLQTFNKLNIPITKHAAQN